MEAAKKGGFAPALEPMQHQLDALIMCERLRNSGAHGMLLADPPGMGKTLTAIACACAAMAGAPGQPVLLVVPKVMFATWKEEIVKHVAHAQRLVWQYPAIQKMEPVLLSSYFVLTTYEKLAAALTRGWRKAPTGGYARVDGHPLLETSYVMTIFDEAHALRNPLSLANQAAHMVACSGTFRLGLTGTPVCNRVSDLAALSAVLGAPLHFHSIHNWYRMCGAKLAEFKRDFMLRRAKSETTDLPECDERDVLVECTPEELAYHDRLVEDLGGQLAAYRNSSTRRTSGMTCVHLHALLTRMRQCAISPDLARTGFGGSDPRTTSEERTRRIELISQRSSSCIKAAIAETASMIQEDRKVIMFCEFTTALEAIAQIVKRPVCEGGLGLDRVQVFCGDSPASMLDDFKTDDKQKLLLMSLKAGGLGLNLAEHASGVVLIGHWWNTSGIRQAIDRVHRMGQKRRVRARVIVAKDTIDQVVRDGMHKIKDENARRLLDTLHVDPEAQVGVEEMSVLMDNLRVKQLSRSSRTCSFTAACTLKRSRIDDEIAATVKRLKCC